MGEEEALVVVRFDEESGPDVGEVFVKPLHGAIGEGNEAVLFAFALSDHEGVLLEVEVVEGEVGEFFATDTGSVETFEKSPVTDADGGGDIGEVEDGFDFLLVEQGRRKAFLELGEFEFAGGISREMVLTAEPFEEGPDGGELDVLIGESEGVAVCFAVMEEVPLIAFKHEPSDLGGLGDATLFKPQDEVGEVEIGVTNGAGGVVTGLLPIEIRSEQ